MTTSIIGKEDASLDGNETILLANLDLVLMSENDDINERTQSHRSLLFQLQHRSA
eukprot:Awhi_evm1s568